MKWFDEIGDIVDVAEVALYGVGIIVTIMVVMSYTH